MVTIMILPYNKELYLVFLPSVSFLLFSLGGTEINHRVTGWKGWRRIVLPIFYYCICVLSGVDVIKAALIMFISIGVFRLGYGQAKSVRQRVIIAILYMMISLPIGFSPWNLITGMSFVMLYHLSNTAIINSVFTWKLVEGVIGLLCGIQIGIILAGIGIVWK